MRGQLKFLRAVNPNYIAQGGTSYSEPPPQIASPTLVDAKNAAAMRITAENFGEAADSADTDQAFFFVRVASPGPNGARGCVPYSGPLRPSLVNERQHSKRPRVIVTIQFGTQDPASGYALTFRRFFLHFEIVENDGAPLLELTGVVFFVLSLSDAGEGALDELSRRPPCVKIENTTNTRGVTNERSEREARQTARAMSVPRAMRY